MKTCTIIRVSLNLNDIFSWKHPIKIDSWKGNAWKNCHLKAILYLVHVVPSLKC